MTTRHPAERERLHQALHDAIERHAAALLDSDRYEREERGLRTQRDQAVRESQRAMADIAAALNALGVATDNLAPPKSLRR